MWTRLSYASMRGVDVRPNFLIFDLFYEKYAFRPLDVLFQYLDLIVGALAYGARLFII